MRGIFRFVSMANQKFARYFLPSFPPPIQAFGGRLQRESIDFENKWIPARARLRGLGRNDGNLCNELATHLTYHLLRYFGCFALIVLVALAAIAGWVYVQMRGSGRRVTCAAVL